jgi:hypothetical protein
LNDNVMRLTEPRLAGAWGEGQGSRNSRALDVHIGGVNRRAGAHVQPVAQWAAEDEVRAGLRQMDLADKLPGGGVTADSIRSFLTMSSSLEFSVSCRSKSRRGGRKSWWLLMTRSGQPLCAAAAERMLPCVTLSHECFGCFGPGRLLEELTPTGKCRLSMAHTRFRHSAIE